jgi:hypothetical protein
LIILFLKATGKPPMRLPRLASQQQYMFRGNMYLEL